MGRQGELCAYFSGTVYQFCFVTAMMVCGTMVKIWTDDASELYTYPTTFMNQVVSDWSEAPFTEFVTSNNTYCPDGYDQFALSRKFYGSDVACDCLGIYSQYITGDNSMNVGTQCDRNQTRYGCQQVSPLQPVVQPFFNNTIICAKNNSTPFVNVTRVESSGNCPSGTTACSSFTNANQTVCFSDTTMCPATNISFVSWSDASKFNQDNTDEPIFTVIGINSYVALAYSTDYPSLPITTTRVVQGPYPCFDPIMQTSSCFYEPELMQQTSCPTDPNSGLMYDERFTLNEAFYTTEYEVQSESSVLSMLAYSPGYTASVNCPNYLQSKQSISLSAYTRPTMSWAIECDWNGESRADAMVYYNYQFDDPKMNTLASKLADALAITAGVFLGIMLLAAFPAICCCKGEDPCLTYFIFVSMIAAAARVAFLVMIPMQFHRVKASEDVAIANLNMIQEYTDGFIPMSGCGDSLNTLNVDTANDYMTTAQDNINKSYWFTFACLMLICTEIFLTCAVPLFAICVNTCCGSCFDRDNVDTEEVVYQKIPASGGNELTEAAYNPDAPPSAYDNHNQRNADYGFNPDAPPAPGQNDYNPDAPPGGYNSYNMNQSTYTIDQQQQQYAPEYGQYNNNSGYGGQPQMLQQPMQQQQFQYQGDSSAMMMGGQPQQNPNNYYKNQPVDGISTADIMAGQPVYSMAPQGQQPNQQMGSFAQDDSQYQN